MESAQQNQSQNQDIKPLAIRVKHTNWQVRRRAYQEIFTNLQRVSSVKQEFNINNQAFTASKLASLLNDIDEEKHPIVLLKGLQCVLKIIELKKSMIKYFNKLVCEGLEKFPIAINQRNQTLQKFKELLSYLRYQPNFYGILNAKLSLPNQKIVHFVIEVIKDLQISALKKKLLQISKKHPKKDVKDRAAEVASLIEDQQQIPNVREQQQVKPSKPVALKKQENKRALEVLDNLHHYQQIQSKKQQRFTEQLLQVINQIALLPSNPQLSNFSYYVQIMVEDNNQIISTNGVKILATLVKHRSQLLPLSYPLLFIFRKFKMHKTHTTNANLFKLTDQLLCSNRSSDLMNAIYEGMCNIEPKVNLKYGCIMTFIRVFCYCYRESQVFQIWCLGQYSQLYENIQNKKNVQKILNRCFEAFRKQKQREYQPIIQKMKEVLGGTYIPEQKTPKNGLNRSESANRLDKQKNIIKNQLNLKTQKMPKGLPAKPQVKPNFNSLVTPEGELNKIMELMKSGNCTQNSLKKQIEKALKCTQSSISEQIFDLFYYCEIAQSFIDDYQSDELFDHLISDFLISYLITISKMPIKESKKSSKIVQKGIEYLLKISVVKLVLSKEIITILNNVKDNLSYDMIVHCLGNFLIMGGECPKKKNKKYLIRWLEQNTSQQLINNQYFQLREAIDSNGENISKKQEIVTPSVLNLPTYQQLKAGSSKPSKQKQSKQKQSNNVTKMQQKINYQLQSQSFQQKIVSYKDNRIQQIMNKPQINKNTSAKVLQLQQLQKFQILQNADISKIEKIEDQQTDRLEERWQYFLNKKGLANQELSNPNVSKNAQQKQATQHYFEEEKYEYYGRQKYEAEDQEQSQKSGNYYANTKLQNPHRFQKQIQELQSSANFAQNLNSQSNKLRNQQVNNKSSSSDEEEIAYARLQNKQVQKSKTKYYYQPDQEQLEQKREQRQEAVKQQGFKYVYLDQKRILYMLSNSGKSFSHLRTLVLNPFKKQFNKCPFLRELTHLIQNQQISKPEPYKSLLLLVIILFSQIKNDKSIIEPLQALYEFMAQHCTNNQFLKTIIGLYHCVIEETEQHERKFLLTILTKSMNRIMPYVQHPLELLRDFQQFYQIGQLVYFQMYPDEYHQIKQMVQNSESLQDVITRAFQQEGQNLNSVVQGWLQSGFKRVIKQNLQELFQEGEQQAK